MNTTSLTPPFCLIVLGVLLTNVGLVLPDSPAAQAACGAAGSLLALWGCVDLYLLADGRPNLGARVLALLPSPGDGGAGERHPGLGFAWSVLSVVLGAGLAPLFAARAAAGQGAWDAGLAALWAAIAAVHAANLRRLWNDPRWGK